MGKLSTHVLDTLHGRPAHGMAIDLYSLRNGERTRLKHVRTNADGRCDAPLLEGADFTEGVYELTFHAGDYFADQGLGEELQRDIEHELPRSEFIIPIGIGVRYALTDKVGLHAEGAYRYTSTDYLDGFSQAGNPLRDDSYYKFSVGVSYKLGKKDALDCPKVGF